MKKYTLLFIVICICACAPKLFAQQDPQFSQYMFAPLYLNPATAGIDNKYAHFSALHRIQWAGYNASFDDGNAPVTSFITARTRLPGTRSGVGLHIVTDKLAALTNNQAILSYAYHLPLKNGTLSFGVRAGLFNQVLDFSKLRPLDQNDPVLKDRTGSLSQFRPDMAAGIFLTRTRYYAGISFNHLTRASFNYGIESVTNRLNNHLTVIGGVNWDVSPNVLLTPSAIIKSDFNTVSAEASVLSTFREKYYVGLSARGSNALDDAILLLGVYLLKDNSLRVGYAFDYVVSGVKAKSATSHEFMVAYRIGLPQPLQRTIIRTPRFRH